MKRLYSVCLFSIISALCFSADYLVTTTSDSGAGSLREAISLANSSPGGDNIFFNIPASDLNYISAEGVWEIKLTSALPMLTGAFINIDATTQASNQGETNPYGPEIRITHSGTTTSAFLIVSPGNTIKGLIISDFEYGILIYNNTAYNNTITENFIGIAYNGMSATPNLNGIGIGGNSQNNTVSANVISGNTQAGIAVTESSGNVIRGNLIGTDPDGMIAIPNLYGIAIQNAASNQIGGSALQDKNIISGNLSAGVVIDGLQSSFNIIRGNYIGLNSGGLGAIPNESGIILSYASETIIGGSAAGHKNIISGNSGTGIILNGTGTRLNYILGNYIGTDLSGTMPISNYAGIVLKSNSNSNYIGGTQAGEGNLVSANLEMGIYVEASDSNIIVGNIIGPNIAGTSAFMTGDTLIQANGVEFNTVAKYNRLGGYTAAERNIISGNRVYGMVYYGNTAYNEVIGNYIGTDVSGSFAIPNATGICVDGGSHHNPIINNVLSGNISYGIFIVTNQTFYNEVKGNKIGTNAAGTDTIPNDAGLLIGGGAKYNVIGGDLPSDKNIISGNRYGGIEISDQYTTDNVIRGNYIGTDITGGIALSNQYGIGITTRPSHNTIDRNLISGNHEFGILLFEFADSNTITRNIIGTTSNQTSPLNNGTAGIIIWGGSSGNLIGGPDMGNIIAFHDSVAIYIKDNNTKANMISENSMFQNVMMGIDLHPEGPNYNDGGDIDDGPNNLMNHPVIQHVAYDPSSQGFWTYGIIDTQTPEGTVIELFVADENQFGRGEGKTFIGKAIANSAGEWFFYGEGIADGELLTATATDITGNTSEFCPNLAVTVSVKESSTLNTILLYPNPVKDDFYVESNAPVKSIRIFSQNGSEIFAETEQAGLLKTNIVLPASLPSGIYHVLIFMETGFVSESFTVQ
jgi:parallel beta-helix repeat protein